jgi:predicted transcriptional regulator
VGQSLTHSIKGDRSPQWRIIYYLKDKTAADKRQIEAACGLPQGEATAALTRLQISKPPIVEVIGGE